MPRSPSPPRYRDRRYRDDSPPRRPFRPDYRERDRDPRGDRWDPRDRDRERDDRRRWDDRDSFRPRRDSYDRYDRYERERSRERFRSPPPRHSPVKEPSSRDSRGSPSKSTSISQTPAGRSGTPEEGQITSPLDSRVRPRSPPRGYRRSPSPPRFRDARFDRERDRDRDWRREPRGRSRSRSPPPFARRRHSRSPSSISTRSRSSRFPSPQKRSPEKRHSPSLRRSPSLERKPSVPFRAPPSGPRSERNLPIPTGPRALSGGYARPPVPTTVKAERLASPPPPPSPVENPYAARPGAPPATSRLSWSERKGVASPSASTSALGDAKPVPSGPANPYQPTPAQIASPPSAPKQEMMEVDLKPAASASVPISGPSEADISARKEREDEMRVLSDLPPLARGYGQASWEVELNNHYKHVQTLVHQTNRAQSAARIAAAVLADAEAERLAATERRKLVEEQLVAGSLGVSLLGGI